MNGKGTEKRVEGRNEQRGRKQKQKECWRMKEKRIKGEDTRKGWKRDRKLGEKEENGKQMTARGR